MERTGSLLLSHDFGGSLLATLHLSTALGVALFLNMDISKGVYSNRLVTMVVVLLIRNPSA